MSIEEEGEGNSDRTARSSGISAPMPWQNSGMSSFTDDNDNSSKGVNETSRRSVGGRDREDRKERAATAGKVKPKTNQYITTRSSRHNMSSILKQGRRELMDSNNKKQ